MVRGGTITAKQLFEGCAEHVDHPGIYGFSVQCAPGMTANGAGQPGLGDPAMMSTGHPALPVDLQVPPNP